MNIETQFSVLLVNKPGVLSQTLTALAREKINIKALTMMDSIEHGMLRLVTERPEKTRQALGRLNLPVQETEVLCLNLPNKSGALAEVATQLAQAHINISYAYCTAGARGGRTTGVLKVADLKKAMKFLRKTTNKADTNEQQKIRTGPAQRGG